MGGRRWTKEEDDKLISLNKEGIKYSDISKMLENRSVYACQNRGLNLGLDGHNNNANTEFFLKDSREMFYILGYWYADGYIGYKNGGTYFDITSIDKEQIEKVKNLMGIKTSILESKANKKVCYRITVGNKKLVTNLMERFGVPFNKTKSIIIDKSLIPEEYFYDFLRGYFDGDGSLVIGSYTKKNGHASITGVKFVGSKNIIVSLYEILKEDYKCSFSKNKKEIDNDCWCVGVYGESGRRLLSNMYNEPTIFLDRKYFKYLEFKNRV